MYYTRHSLNIKNQKPPTNWDAVCTHVTSSAVSHDSAVKLTTDSYQLHTIRRFACIYAYRRYFIDQGPELQCLLKVKQDLS